MARVRSPNYPAVSLKTAIEQVQKVYAKEGTHKASPEVVAKALGYGGLNGASLTSISALKKYGLLEEVGSKQLKITQEALVILVDPADSVERAKAIQAAAFGPTLFAELRKEYGSTAPSDDNLRAYLLKRGFNQGAVAAPIRAYRETLELVSESLNVYSGEVEEPNPDGDIVEKIERAFSPSAPLKSPPLKPPVSGHEVASFPVATDNVIRLVATGPLSKKSVETLIKHLQLGLDVGVYPDDEEETES